MGYSHRYAGEMRRIWGTIGTNGRNGSANLFLKFCYCIEVASLITREK